MKIKFSNKQLGKPGEVFQQLRMLTDPSDIPGLSPRTYMVLDNCLQSNGSQPVGHSPNMSCRSDIMQIRCLHYNP